MAKKVVLGCAFVTVFSLLLACFPVQPPPTATFAPTSTPTATPSPTPTPIPLYGIGEKSQWGDLSISIQSYVVTDKCRGHGDGPAKGAKLIYIWVTVQNVGDDMARVPDLMFVHNEKYSDWFGGTVCRYDDEALGNACWEWDGKLYPGVSCKGWELFEVPESMQVEGTLVEVLVHVPGQETGHVGKWRLEAIKSASVPTATPTPTPTLASPPPTLTASPMSRAQMGDTIPEVGWECKNLSMTLTGWKESWVAVDGPYMGDQFYTFTATPGMKFVVLTFEFHNNDTRAQYTPYLDEGEIETDAGQYYAVWSPPAGIHSDEYSPVLSTADEVIELVGTSGGFVELLPGKSAAGCIVFEIPTEQQPVKAQIKEVPVPIGFE